MVDTHHFARTHHVGSSPGTVAGPVADSPCSTLSQALRPRARVDSLGDLQMGEVDFGWPNVYLIFELSSCLLFDHSSMAVVVLAVCLVSMDVLLALYDEADGSLEAGEILAGLFKDTII
ncbi:hypothetical protein NL676_012752 [Syzygium grande]|nr:hypothetical protein NL676_012752 [Syzygium grande]